jgi:hypothetical protein
MSFATHLREHRRLVILRCLAEIAAQRANTSVLTDGCNHFGITSTRDDVRTDVAWLCDQGLVRTEELTEAVRLVVLTERGADVAEGRAIVPGVRRPTPR